jgi:alpha-tubulin suppressor-like RCC1 family protein
VSTDAAVPQPVAGGLSFIQLSAGEAHNCGLTTAGPAYCWGDNAYGQLGDGDASTASLTPVAVSGSSIYVTISAGGLDVTAPGGHSCASIASGALYCWGLNDSGQLGDGTNVDRSTPIRVP